MGIHRWAMDSPKEWLLKRCHNWHDRLNFMLDIYSIKDIFTLVFNSIHSMSNLYTKPVQGHSQTSDKRVCNMDHCNAVIMSAMASQITNLTTVYSIIHSGADQRKHQSSTSLVFVRGIHRWPVNSPHKGPVMLKYFHLMTSSCVTSAWSEWSFM